MPVFTYKCNYNYLSIFLITGKYSEFLTKQLSTVKDFIKKDLIGGLRGATESVQGLVPIPTSSLTQALPLPDYYQALFDSSINSVDNLAVIAEATGEISLKNAHLYLFYRTYIMYLLS